jgi:hypothetical protein
VTPTGWQGSAGGVVVVRSSNGPWGGLAAPSGTHFISIQGDGKWIQQEACGLTPGARYTMTFQMTHRPGYGNDEEGFISVDGVQVWSSPNPMPGVFTAYLAVFQANSNGTAMIRIENDSPAGDKSIFIDDISLAVHPCPQTGVSLANADFGADSGVSGFTYVTPTSWQGSAGGVVVVQSRNGAWGGLAAPSGTHFISIQFNGKWIQQEACGLAPGAWYNMTFQMTHRPGYGNDEAGIIQVDGSTVWSSPVPMPDSFTTYSAVFQANSNGTAMIRIENDSPAGDKSIFIDDISLTSQ